MKVAVLGAGAIGAYVGAALARGGADVTLVARGPQLEALRERGVTVRSERGDFSAQPAATGDARSIGPVDVVILAVKAYQIEPLLDSLPSLFGDGDGNDDRDGTAVVAMQNGIPWWYFSGAGGPHDGRVVRSVDPDGRIARAIEPRRVVGCVVYAATAIEAPGIVRHVEGTRFSLGDPAGGVSARTRRIAEAFAAGGLKAPLESDLRPEIWTKLLGNASFNPISALTRATLSSMCDDPPVEALAAEMMREIVAVAAAHGVTLPISIEQRIDGARRVGPHKTSMLQDLEAGKPLELDALTGSVLELGELANVATPATRHVYALTKLLAGQHRSSLGAT
jgi:2-dehydropantoate 2-reductase